MFRRHFSSVLFLADAGRRAALALALLLATQSVLGAFAVTDTLRDAHPPRDTFAVQDVRVFDGERVHERTTVLVQDGRIAALGADLTIPDGVPIIAGAGRTLLPGFIDAHVHAFEEDVLVQALAFGVTLQFDMFGLPLHLTHWRDEQTAGRAQGRADLLGAGYLATAPGGHGTQFGLPVPTLQTAAEAAPWVAARAAEGSDYIKIVLEDGSPYGLTRNTLDDATLAALVAAAHEHGLLAVVHVSRLADAERALRAGADGLVHLWIDAVPSEDFARELAEAGVFVVPTLVVMEAMLDEVPGRQSRDDARPGGAALLEDPDALSLLFPAARASIEHPFQVGRAFSWTGMREAIRRLHAAGVPLLTGSDAPNPGTAFGASLHRELELLVLAGLSPAEALRAATAAPADAFQLASRANASAAGVPGRIVVGAPADLILVDGNPLADIKATRRIVALWKRGEPFDDAAQRARVAAAVAAAEAPPPAPDLEGGRLLVGEFDDGGLGSRLGVGWSPSTDEMAGGTSRVALEVVPNGAGDTPGALRVHGEIKGPLAFAWAGAFYMPGSRPFLPVDLSATRGVAFQVKGEGPAFQFMAFSEATGRIPVGRPFSVSAEWTEVSIPWSTLPGIDPAGITAILISAGPAPGNFDIHVDQVEFR